MKPPPPENQPQIRIRVSTVLLLLAGSLAPFSIFNIQPLWFPDTPEYLHHFAGWLHYQFPFLLFFVGSIISLVASLIFAVHRHWQAFIQSLVESALFYIGLCFPPGP